MSKRNKIIVQTSESFALKELRLMRDLSLRQLAEKLNLSFARVHQMETGREDITDEYVKLFCKKLAVSDHEWSKLTGVSNVDHELLEECFELLRGLNQEKVEAVYEVLRVL